MNPKLSAVSRPNCAVSGRRLKKRCQGKLGEVVTRVLQTKEGLPMPKDIIKTANNKEYNEDLPFMVAWRAINDNVPRQRKADVMNFQLIIPYLVEMRKCNPLSLMAIHEVVDATLLNFTSSLLLQMMYWRRCAQLSPLTLHTFGVSTRACFTLRRFCRVATTFIRSVFHDY